MDVHIGNVLIKNHSRHHRHGHHSHYQPNRNQQQQHQQQDQHQHQRKPKSQCQQEQHQQMKTQHIRYKNGLVHWHHVPTWRMTFWVLFVCLLSPALPEVIYRVDPLALLAATLRTYQRAGCDSEQLSLSCPRGTSISIELAQYGRAGDLSDHSLCPPLSQEDLTTTGSTSDSVIRSGTEIEVKPPEICTVNGLQYALLQAVVDACQKKRHCKFATNSKSLPSNDACSGIRKFVEIAYKCRPYEFRSKVACENDNMPLVCNPYSRIAIYSASFGHIERESMQCGHGNSPVGEADDSNKQTCLVSYATETIMQICHGRRRCSVTADVGTFGRPCKNEVRMYLKVVYTCIPRKVLKDRYETAPEADEPQQTDLDIDQDELYDEDQFYKESEAIPPAPKLQGAIPNPIFPYQFNLDSEFATSTLLPPLLTRNDSNLEDQFSANNESEDWDNFNFNSTETPNIDSNIDLLNISNDHTENESIKIPWKHFFFKRRSQVQCQCNPSDFNSTVSGVLVEEVKVLGFLENWARAYVYIKKNQEEFYLYLIISVVVGVLLCLTLVIGRLTLQRRRSSRKNSCSSDTNEKNCSDGSGGLSGRNYQPGTASKPHLRNSYGGDISDIDGDIDLTSPMPVPSLSSRKETYLTYAPTVSCAYGISDTSGTATTAMNLQCNVNTSHASQFAASTLPGPSIVGNSRQPAPPPVTLYTSMGVCSPSVSAAMTMGPHMLTASALGSVSQHSNCGPAYLSGSIMVPGHHHTHLGTLRRSIVPTNSGLQIGTASPLSSAVSGSTALTGMPTTSGIYYDSTVPRNLSRGMSADNTQYFFG